MIVLATHLKIWVHVSEEGVLVGRGVKHVEVLVEVKGCLAGTTEIVRDKSGVQSEIFIIVRVAATAIVSRVHLGLGSHDAFLVAHIIREGDLGEVLSVLKIVTVVVVLVVEVRVIIDMLIGGSYYILVEVVSLVALV
jgi:hypothetical protein